MILPLAAEAERKNGVAYAVPCIPSIVDFHQIVLLVLRKFKGIF